MSVMQLDHVNIVTANLEGMSAFYRDILGLAVGKRPPFGVDGRWHYTDGRAVVHLVDKPVSPRQNGLQLEHFAFRSAGLTEFLAKLRRNRVSYHIDIVPELGIRSANIYDPDGNHIEVLFDAGEHADVMTFDANEAGAEAKSGKAA